MQELASNQKMLKETNKKLISERDEIQILKNSLEEQICQLIAENNNKTIIDENVKYLKTSSSIEELKSVKARLKSEIDSDELKCNEEVEKKNKYKVSNFLFKRNKLNI
jgi:site-specific DNA-cytosine methylase